MTATATVSQQLTALAAGNEIRVARAALKRDLFALPADESRNLAALIFLDPPPEAGTMKVSALLASVRRMGPTTTRKLLKDVGVSEFRKLNTLTDRERDALAQAVVA